MLDPGMYLRLVLAWLALSGCFDDRYTCATDADCDLGVAGRCEIDHACSSHDASCASGRRYSPHSGPESGTCFDDRIALADLCAAGQPPPLADACTSNVCRKLTACCETAWTEACVELAEIEPACNLTCVTRIAIVASRGASMTETWTLDWSGTAWTGTKHGGSVVAWLAPAPGKITPRLATIDPAGRALSVDDGTVVSFGADHDVRNVASVDFDRDGRDTVAIDYLDTQAPTADHAAIIKLGDRSVRELGALDATQRLSWGDYDHDGFPDAIGVNGSRYDYFDNAEPPDTSHIRGLNNITSRSMPGNMLGNTTPAVRSVDWVDFDNDGTLDAVLFGNAVRVHLGMNVLSVTPLFTLDCDPPSMTCSEAGYVSLAGAVVADPVRSQLLVSVDNEPAATPPTRNLYRITADTVGAPQALAFSPAACGTPCQPIRAVVVRDLDGDHQLDIVAIDAKLGVFVALSGSGGLSTLHALPSGLLPTTIDPAQSFTAVRVSVSGVPR
ncbi:MAG: hypothetical protein JWO36_3632 [Myxococcales bacterium]|nr:hypothetical protein [Myxococcales bacterium]